MKLVSVLACGALLTASCAGDGKQTSPAAQPAACVEPALGYAPTDVFCTGLYEARSPDQHAASAVPYTPGVTFWSDGAEKHRYLYLPPGSTIDTSDMDAWKFPLGTKAWKEFRLAGALVETRLLWKQSQAGWVTATYIWDTDGKSATLNTSRLPTLTETGYEIPALKTCDKCHAGAPDTLLGVEALLLALPTAQGVTLSSLADAGALSAPPAQTALTLPEDGTGNAAAALGYLHVNCGVACHSERGLAHETLLDMRLRAEQFWPAAGVDPATMGVLSVATTDAFATTVEQPVKTATYAQSFPDTLRITPGSHELSLLWRVAHLRGEHQMPPIVSHEVDEVGTQQLADWIDALGN